MNDKTRAQRCSSFTDCKALTGLPDNSKCSTNEKCGGFYYKNNLGFKAGYFEKCFLDKFCGTTGAQISAPAGLSFAYNYNTDIECLDS